MQQCSTGGGGVVSMEMTPPKCPHLHSWNLWIWCYLTWQEGLCSYDWILRWEDHPELSKWVQCSHRHSRERRQECPSQREKETMRLLPCRPPSKENLLSHSGWHHPKSNKLRSWVEQKGRGRADLLSGWAAISTPPVLRRSWRRGPWTGECRPPPEARKGKGTDSLLWLCWHLDFSPVRPFRSWPPQRKIIHLCCFKPWSL